MTGPTASLPGLVAVAATVKGPPAQVRGFAARNLRAGADHVVLFVDDADPAVLRLLAEDDEVAPATTAIGTDAAYWGGQDQWPVNLNRRQGMNANLANALVSTVPRFTWLFHLDLDERLHLDKHRLLAVDPSVRAVELTTWEAVSTEQPVEPTRYKRRPTSEELDELHRRGLIDKPSVHAFFRGHIGKRGIRPDPRVRLRIHHVMEPDGKVAIEPVRTDWLHVLHDESDSYDEFVRKWRTLLSSGSFGQKRRRARVARLVAPLLTDESLDPAVREQQLREVFRRHAADDVAAIEELGLLAVPDPAWSAYRPEPLTDDEQETLARVAALLTSAPKTAFERFGPPAEQLLQRLHGSEAAGRADPLVLAGLGSALSRAGSEPAGGPREGPAEGSAGAVHDEAHRL